MVELGDDESQSAGPCRLIAELGCGGMVRVLLAPRRTAVLVHRG